MTISIHPIKLGFEHCYVVRSVGTILIDGGSPNQAHRFVKAMTRLNIDPKKVDLILITHGHWDHIGSARAIKEITIDPCKANSRVHRGSLA
jgi:hydroxyacylglutathione hydrolase